MPGGYLNYGIYKLLGGERSFGDFWFQLGLPVIAVILGSLVLLVLKLEVLNVIPGRHRASCSSDYSSPSPSKHAT